MGEPPAELLPGGAELVPRVRRQAEGVALVGIEKVAELLGDMSVDDDSVFFIVPTQ